MQEILSSTHMLLHCITCCVIHSMNSGSQEQDMRSPAYSATSATSLLHGANMSIYGLYLHVTLINFTTVQMNEIEPTRSNPAGFPKIRNLEITTTT